MTAGPYLLGIDLGGSSIKALVATESGEAVTQRQVEFDASQSMQWAEKIRGVIAELETGIGGEFASVGLSAPGLVNEDQRSIRQMPGRLFGIEGLDWTEYLGRARPVPILNDAHAALAGEAWVGAVKAIRNVVMVTLGTGVGGAAMVDGRLLRGAIGRAGHLGHICLDPEGELDICRTPGSLELAVGNCSIEQRTQGRFRSTHDLVAAVEQGDPEARTWWQNSVRDLACGLVSLVNVLDPEAIVIGGGITRAGKGLFGPLEAYFRQYEWEVGEHRVALVPAALGELAGAYGAAITGWRFGSGE